MFLLTCLGQQYGPLSLEVVCTTISCLRDVDVYIRDLRDGGKAHRLTIAASGFIHEAHASRLVVDDVRTLLEAPGRPVYA